MEAVGKAIIYRYDNDNNGGVVGEGEPGLLVPSYMMKRRE